MAPKKSRVIENPPMASLTEEEEEESGSSEEESDSDSDDQAKKPNVVPLSSKMSEGATDSDPEPAKKKKAQNSLVTKSNTVVPPEISTAKRSFEKKEDVGKKKRKTSTIVEVKKMNTSATVEMKTPATVEVKKMKTSATVEMKTPATVDVKKMKTSTEEEETNKVSGDETKKQPMFQRLFSEEDEVALLQGILDFTSKRGDPSADLDAFCGFVKKLISFDASKTQIATKVRNLKKKFENIVKTSLKRGKGGEEEIVFSKEIDGKAFELYRKIWGNEGVLVSKSRKKKKSLPQEAEKTETKIKSNHLSSSSREIVSVFKAENVTCFGLDESTMIAGWDKVEDGPKKREMEARLKKMKEMQMELCLLRIGLVAKSLNAIFKASSSGK